MKSREFSDDELPGEPNHASLVRDAVLSAMETLPVEYRGGESEAFNLVWKVGKFASETGLTPAEARKLAALDISEFMVRNKIEVVAVERELVSSVSSS